MAHPKSMYFPTSVWWSYCYHWTRAANWTARTGDAKLEFHHNTTVYLLMLYLQEFDNMLSMRFVFF